MSRAASRRLAATSAKSCLDYLTIPGSLRTEPTNVWIYTDSPEVEAVRVPASPHRDIAFDLAGDGAVRRASQHQQMQSGGIEIKQRRVDRFCLDGRAVSMVLIPPITSAGLQPRSGVEWPGQSERQSRLGHHYDTADPGTHWTATYNAAECREREAGVRPVGTRQGGREVAFGAMARGAGTDPSPCT